MRTFELFIQNEKLPAADWQKFVANITTYDKKITLEMVIDLNTVSLYLYTQKDLSLLATGLESFLLKPSNRQLIGNLVAYKKLQLKVVI